MTDDKVIYLAVNNPRAPAIMVQVNTEILYLDSRVCLARYTLLLNDKVISVEEVMAKLNKEKS